MWEEGDLLLFSLIGLFGLVSSLLSLLCHAALELAVALSSHDWLLLVILGLSPLGAACFLWDKALKLGDARQIGILSYLTPLLSTTLLMLTSGASFSWSIGLAAVMILGAAGFGDSGEVRVGSCFLFSGKAENMRCGVRV